MDNILFTTVVGSHVWKMDTLDSDIDCVSVYVTSTADILRGLKIKRNTFVEGDIDHTHYEIGSFIKNLIKGDINAITAVMSPVESIFTRNFYLYELQKIVTNNLSQNVFDSVNGLTRHNYQKYIINRKEVSNQKRINTICRVLKYGIHLLETGCIKFYPYYGTVDEIPILLKELEVAKLNSCLPDSVEDTPFREFLLDVRIKELKGDL